MYRQHFIRTPEKKTLMVLLNYRQSGCQTTAAYPSTVLKHSHFYSMSYLGADWVVAPCPSNSKWANQISCPPVEPVGVRDAHCDLWFCTVFDSSLIRERQDQCCCLLCLKWENGNNNHEDQSVWLKTIQTEAFAAFQLQDGFKIFGAAKCDHAKCFTVFVHITVYSSTVILPSPLCSQHCCLAHLLVAWVGFLRVKWYRYGEAFWFSVWLIYNT